MGHDALFDAAIRLEKKCAAAYHALSVMFPEKRDLFGELAFEEDNHVVILKVARAYVLSQKLSPEAILPLSLSQIREGEKIADAVIAEIAGKNLTLRRALSLVLSLEKSLGEICLSDSLSRADAGVMLKLKQMCFDEATHVARIERALADLAGE